MRMNCFILNGQGAANQINIDCYQSLLKILTFMFCFRTYCNLPFEIKLLHIILYRGKQQKNLANSGMTRSKPMFELREWGKGVVGERQWGKVRCLLLFIVIDDPDCMDW